MTTTSTSWTDGYVAELDYTHGYYREMAPLHLELAALNKQFVTSMGRPLRYLELGFGQGLSLNIHAAACGGEFWGTDFNPSQAANARELARASGAAVTVLDDSFAELAARDDLPEFDIIALHGIWSWISDENRRHIVEIARRKLSVGGLFYISYNTTPGWSAAIPLRHLMSLHLQLASGEAQGLSPRIDQALSFAEKVVDSNALYFKANPAVAERLKGMKAHNRNYLAHEFFNADWHPMPFSEAAGYLESAKLTFVASANLTSHLDALSLTPQQQQLLSEVKHPVLRESVRDYCENQQFRRDVFSKGPRSMSSQRRNDEFLSLRFAMRVQAKEISLKVKGATGEANLQQEVYQPILAVMEADRFAPKTVAEMARRLESKKITPAQIIQAMIVLVGLGHVSPAYDAAHIASRRPFTSALNAYIMDRAIYSGDISFLASPVIGGGVSISRIHLLFLRSALTGKSTAQELALDVWPLLEAQGQRLMRDGKPIEVATENVSELSKMAAEFLAERLPIYSALLIADVARHSEAKADLDVDALMSARRVAQNK